MPHRPAAPRSLLTLLFAAILFTSAPACGVLAGGTPAAPTPHVLRVGVIVTMTEKGATTSGQPTTNAAQLAVAQLNAAGGLLIAGQPYTVELVLKDDADKPETAVLVAQELINQDRVIAIIGPQYSRNAIPVAAVAEAAHVPMISPMSTNPETTQDKHFVFRVAFVDSFQGRVMADFAYDDLHARRAALLYDTASAYNNGIAQIFMAAFIKRGGAIVANETYTTDQSQDFSAQLARIATTQPDVLFLPNYTKEVILQGPQARAAGITAQLIGSDGWNGTSLASEPAFNGAYFSHHWHPDVAAQASFTFSTAYTQTYHMAPVATAAMTYDAFGLLFAALRQASAPTGDEIRTNLLNLTDYAGITGAIRYHDSGDPEKPAVIIKLDDGHATFFKLIQPTP